MGDQNKRVFRAKIASRELLVTLAALPGMVKVLLVSGKLQRFPLNLSCERKTICNMLFGNWL